MVNILLDIGVDSINLVALAGIFTPLIVLSVILLLIARFRGFWASLFFIPAILSILSFALTFEAVTSIVEGIGAYGEGLLAGISVLLTPFTTFHTLIIALISELVKVEMVTKILTANWFAMIPYVLFFIIFFSTCKIKKVKKEVSFF